METLSVELTDELVAKLKEASAKMGIQTSEFIKMGIQEKINHFEQEFDQAADYVLKKNEELYHRLA